MNAKLILVLIVWPWMAMAQGFAGLGTSADGFAVPQPDPQFVFPRDHGPHPDFRIEWWYLTANLRDDRGVEYGLQWTLFRSALAPQAGEGWDAPQLWMGHAAVTTPDAHFVTERLARGGIGQAGVTDAPFEAWIDEWSLKGDWQEMGLRAAGPDFGYDMALVARGPLVFHGKDGYSVKSAEGQASYYYSQPFFQIAGTLQLPTGDVAVSGEAWLDREWSSQPLAEGQSGWDWFSLSFDDGAKLMGFQLREDGRAGYSAATWIDADGRTTPYDDGAFVAVPIATHETAGGTVPVTWQVTLPQMGVDVIVAAQNKDAWMTTSVPYWEGPVDVSGSHDGRGYLEMTGYE